MTISVRISVRIAYMNPGSVANGVTIGNFLIMKRQFFDHETASAASGYPRTYSVTPASVRDADGHFGTIATLTQ